MMHLTDAVEEDSRGFSPCPCNGPCPYPFSCLLPLTLPSAPDCALTLPLTVPPARRHPPLTVPLTVPLTLFLFCQPVRYSKSQHQVQQSCHEPLFLLLPLRGVTSGLCNCVQNLKQFHRRITETAVETSALPIQ